MKTGSSLFKSGFLLNTPNRNGNPTSSAKSDDIIRPQQSREEELRIQDVQDAIQSDRIQQGRLAGVLITWDLKMDYPPCFWLEFTSDSFLQNALNDPAVASLLASDDPEIQLAIQVFSQNPALALTQFAHRADVIEALKSFAGHFGNHLTRLSETPSVQAKSKAQTDTNDESRLQPLVQIPQELDQSEKDLIKRVMADREVQSALKDVRVQQVMLKMKAGDPEGYRLLRTYSQDADMQHKIRKLVQVGLLQFQS